MSLIFNKVDKGLYVYVYVLDDLNIAATFSEMLQQKCDI